ncbi:AMP-binding protein [Parahaliea maris]|uniref:AMP-binding protein n=1 Tax=Parahaliea maris TaxID=2716870 RepID=UPI0016505CFA|nr:AMP-binding protein [Parahaliea maris]
MSTVFRHWAELAPDRDFLLAGNDRLTYVEAYGQACRYAGGLAARGVGRDDRVAIFMDSCPEFVLVSLACSLVGAQWIPINTDYRGEWLRQTLADSDPKLLVTDQRYLPRVEELCKGVVEDIIVREGAPGYPGLEDLQAQSQGHFEPAGLDPGDVASVMWTSGTTGRSKGVMQSHNAWVRSALSAAEMGAMSPGDVVYNCLPLYNSAAWVANIYPALVSGIAVAIDPAFSAGNFWDRTRHYGATHVFTLGAMHMFLWKAPEQADDADNPVRSATMTPMPHDIHRAFCERFGIESINQGFGQSEIMLLTRNHDDGVRELVPNALGEPADDLEVALLDEQNRPVAVGEVGEFCVKPRGEHILFNGYFNNPEATAEAFSGGWYHTGDLGKQDEQGNYFFVDRKKDLIRYKGRSVSSLAIEAIARRHPAIKDVAVYGITSAELSSEHEIMLAAVLNPEAVCSPAELARFINDNAPYFFVPRYIEFMPELPMTPTQKVRKVEMRQRGIADTTWDARAAGFEVER